MALDLTKYNIQSMDTKEVLDSRKKGQRWPESMTGSHKTRVLSFRFVPPSKDTTDKQGKMHAFFESKVRILESANPQAVGREYPVSFCLTCSSAKSQEIATYSKRQFVAACVGQSEEDPNFKADAAQQELLDADESGELGDDGPVIFQTTTTTKKPKAILENGVAKTIENTYVNHTFAPVR